MKTLILLRHSETDISDFGQEDHEKDISNKGKSDSVLISKWFKDTGLSIDRLLVSSSKRTQITAKLVFPLYADNMEVDPRLYLCSKLELKNIILQTVKSVRSLAIVGHEPSIGEVLSELVGKTRPDLDDIVRSNYPTSGLSIVVFNTLSWEVIVDKEGVLDAFVSPNSLKIN